MTRQHAELEQSIANLVDDAILEDNGLTSVGTAAAREIIDLLYGLGHLSPEQCGAPCKHGGNCIIELDRDGHHDGDHSSGPCTWPQTVGG